MFNLFKPLIYYFRLLTLNDNNFKGHDIFRFVSVSEYSFLFFVMVLRLVPVVASSRSLSVTPCLVPGISLSVTLLLASQSADFQISPSILVHLRGLIGVIGIVL